MRSLQYNPTRILDTNSLSCFRILPAASASLNKVPSLLHHDSTAHGRSAIDLVGLLLFSIMSSKLLNLVYFVLVTITFCSKVSFALPVLPDLPAQRSGSADAGAVQSLTALLQRAPETHRFDVVGGLRPMECEMLNAAEQNQEEHMRLLLSVRPHDRPAGRPRSFNRPPIRLGSSRVGDPRCQ